MFGDVPAYFFTSMLLRFQLGFGSISYPCIWGLVVRCQRQPQYWIHKRRFMRKILVVEDDPAIGQGVFDSLEWAGYQPQWRTCGRSGLDAALEASFDLVLLDLALPKLDGLEVLTELRSSRPQQAVIILTARGSEQDRIRGLQLGLTTMWSSRSVCMSFWLESKRSCDACRPRIRLSIISS